MKEEKINYITGAVHKIEAIDEKTNRFFLHADDNEYYCRKELGAKVSSGYKFGIKDTSQKGKYEIVSIEQQMIATPAFAVNPPQPNFEQVWESAGKQMWMQAGEKTIEQFKQFQTQPQVRMAQMPYDDFRDLVSNRNVMIRSKALEVAEKVTTVAEYEDRKSFSTQVLVDEIIRIAHIFEKYLEA